VEPVSVVVRVRPILEKEKAVEVNCVEVDNSFVMLKNQGSRSGDNFQFSKVCGEEYDQKTFYDKIAHPVVEKFMKGTNGLIFSYGVTNSGKTFTHNGTENDPGMIPRALNVIFDSIQKKWRKKLFIKKR